MSLKCPECGHVGDSAGDEAMSAIGGAQCEECGHTDLEEEFEHVDD